jgi:predicted esterase
MAKSVPNSKSLVIQTEVLFTFLPPRHPPGPLLIALHQYGSNKDEMLSLAREFSPPSFGILSVQGPHQHTRISRRTGDAHAGYGWGTLDNQEAAVRFHQESLQKILQWVIEQRIAAPGEVFLAGFSEPVPLNYRYAQNSGRSLKGLLSFCGLVPECTKVKYLPPAFHLAGASDPVAHLARIAGRIKELQSLTDSLRFAVYEAGHQITDEMKRDARNWLASLAAN